MKRALATHTLNRMVSPVQSFLSLVNSTDILFSAGAALFSLLLFLGVWQGMQPFIALSGDAANVASFAAARQHPEAFARDALLRDFNNYRGYVVATMPILDWLAERTGDYGTAFAWMLGPHVFIQLLGFYILGRVLYHSRYLAVLLAILCSVTVIIAEGRGDFWGLWFDALPRVTFQALLPYLLALVIVWHQRPVLYPVIMLLTGLLLYTHPVSGPGWGLTIWLGLLAVYPASWSWRRKLATAFLLGCIYLLMITPFMLLYTGTYRSGATFDYDLMYGMLSHFFATYLDVPGMFLAQVEWFARTNLLPAGIGGLMLVYWLRRDERPLVRMLGIWLIGTLFVAVVLPVAEQALSAVLHRLPSQLDLVRGLRFVVPLLMIYGLWAVASVPTSRYQHILRGGAYFLAGLFTLYWATSAWVTSSPLYLINRLLTQCFPQNMIVCPRTIYDIDEMELFQVIQERTPPDAVFLPTYRFFAVRYAGLRSLLYQNKDIGILFYYNHTALFELMELERRLGALLALPDPRERSAAMVKLAYEYQADYLLLKDSNAFDRAEFNDWNARILFDATYILVDLGRHHAFEPNRINVWDSSPPVIGFCAGEDAIDLYGLDAALNGYQVARIPRTEIEFTLAQASAFPVMVTEQGDYSLWALSPEKLQLRYRDEYFYVFPAQWCFPSARRFINPLDDTAPLHAYCVKNQGVELYTADDSRQLASVSFEQIETAMAQTKPEAPVLLTENLRALSPELLDLVFGDYRHVFALARCQFE